MTLHIRARAVSEESIQEARETADSLPSREEFLAIMEELFEASGGRGETASVAIEEAETEDGVPVDPLQFQVTARYIKDGRKYVAGDGVILDYTSMMDALADLMDAVKE